MLSGIRAGDAADEGLRRHTLSTREQWRTAIAAQLAAGHGRPWNDVADRVRREYLTDADALIDQGMTPFWSDHHPGSVPSPALEAEVFEFDRSMEWFMSFLDARHPQWRQTRIYPSSHIEEADPVEWDAWVTIAVSVSEEARRLWAQRYAEQTGEPAAGERAPLAPPPASAPAAARDVRRIRFATAVGAVLANRHQRRWMELPIDVKAAYLADAESLIGAGLLFVG